MLISVITAVYNGAKHLPILIDSLRNQTDADFEWVVADGASTDNTLVLLNNVDDLNMIVSSFNDFGVYDGLNRAINKASGLYYLVCGADDYLNKDAIYNYKQAINSSNADIITAKYIVNKKVKGVKHSVWLYGINSIISSHSIGSVFKRSLHDKYGYYSKYYPICADKLFVEKVYMSGASIQKCNFVAGIYSGFGLSSINTAKTLSEGFCVSLELGRNKLIQIILFFMRIIKNFNYL